MYDGPGRGANLPGLQLTVPKHMRGTAAKRKTARPRDGSTRPRGPAVCLLAELSMHGDINSRRPRIQPDHEARRPEVGIIGRDLGLAFIGARPCVVNAKAFPRDQADPEPRVPRFPSRPPGVDHEVPMIIDIPNESPSLGMIRYKHNIAASHRPSVDADRPLNRTAGCLQQRWSESQQEGRDQHARQAGAKPEAFSSHDNCSQAFASPGRNANDTGGFIPTLAILLPVAEAHESCDTSCPRGADLNGGEESGVGKIAAKARSISSLRRQSVGGLQGDVNLGSPRVETNRQA